MQWQQCVIVYHHNEIRAQQLNDNTYKNINLQRRYVECSHLQSH